MCKKRWSTTFVLCCLRAFAPEQMRKNWKFLLAVSYKRQVNWTPTRHVLTGKLAISEIYY